MKTMLCMLAVALAMSFGPSNTAHASDGDMGGIFGTIIGGYVGSRIGGRGNGKTAATILGAIIGGNVGRSMHRHDSYGGGYGGGRDYGYGYGGSNRYPPTSFEDCYSRYYGNPGAARACQRGRSQVDQMRQYELEREAQKYGESSGYRTN